MDLRFIVTVTEHRFLGHVFAPYLVQTRQEKGIISIHDRITTQNLERYRPALSPEEVQIIKYIEDYNDQNLQKVFSKKKLTAREFIAKLDDELLNTQIRPYVERRMKNCIDLLQINPVPVYQKFLPNSIYESDRLELIDEEGNTVFNFNRTNEGIQYHLSIEHNEKELKLTGSQGIVICNEPCCLILQNKLFVFRDIDGKKLMPFFDKEYIFIPRQTEKKYFETFVTNTIRNHRVKATGFIIETIRNTPRPILAIEKGLSHNLMLTLRFAYDNNTVYQANSKSDNKIDHQYSPETVHFKKIERNPEAENDTVSRLLSLGLKNIEGAMFTPHSKKDDSEKKDYLLINWVNYNREVLGKYGIEIAQNKLDVDYYTDNFDLKFEVSDKESDWFDINAHVEFQGFRIPFVAFKEHIKHGEREYVLPNGKVLILPEEWFESFRDVVTFAREKDGSFQLDKQHFALLNKNFGRQTGGMREKLAALLDAGDAELEPAPTTLKAQLRPYQQQGYTWLYRLYQNGFGGCLADDMGLGKTLQTLSMLQRVIDEQPHEPVAATEIIREKAAAAQLDLFGESHVLQNTTTSRKQPSLVVVPTSLLHNWASEVDKFYPNLNATIYAGSDRGDIADISKTSDIIITSYGTLRNDIEKIKSIRFLYLILDESQMVKNPGSKTYIAVNGVKADNRMVLTGTPIENSLTDLWAQMNLVNPGLLGSLMFFKNMFATPIEKKNDQEKMQRLQQIISPFILRRTKTTVAKELPELTEQVIFCDMSDPQEVLYEREKSRARNLVLESIDKYGFNKSAIMILQSLTKLRQIANHPAMVDADYLAESGKFDEIKRRLHTLKAENHKTLIFSSFVKHIDIVADYLDQEGLPFVQLTGETRDRKAVIDEFQNNPNCQFFLISLKAGGIGLNLTAASYVLILDPWWNPAAEMQAISRAHRIGQEKQVMVYRFISRNTLEEKIIKLQQKKHALAEAFINEEGFKMVNSDDVMELFD